MTGKYCHNNGVLRNSVKLPEEQRCIAEVFKEAGYKTGYIGKWHLSGLVPPLVDFVPPGAGRQGWDYMKVFALMHQYHNSFYYLDSGQRIQVAGYEPDFQTNMAIDYMKENVENPFCLMLSWGPPHPPRTPPEEFDTYNPLTVPLRPNVQARWKKVWQQNIAKYYGLITNLDYNVGRLMEALDDLGIADDTIVCFTSDHGEMLGSQGKRGKHKPFEESIRIPFIMSYPRKIRREQKLDVLYNSVDVMPTLLGLCELPIPDGVQGTDLSPVILGKKKKGPESAYFAIRAEPPTSEEWRAIRTKEWKYAKFKDSDWVMYNLEKDPFEMHNLVAEKRYQEKKEELKKALDAWMEKTGDSFESVVQGPLSAPTIEEG